MMYMIMEIEYVHVHRVRLGFFANTAWVAVAMFVPSNNTPKM